MWFNKILKLFEVSEVINCGIFISFIYIEVIIAIVPFFIASIINSFLNNLLFSIINNEFFSIFLELVEI